MSSDTSTMEQLRGLTKKGNFGFDSEGPHAQFDEDSRRYLKPKDSSPITRQTPKSSRTMNVPNTKSGRPKTSQGSKGKGNMPPLCASPLIACDDGTCKNARK